MSNAGRETIRLSPSIAHKLIDECPLSAWSAHRLLGNNRKKSTDSQLDGQLWHAGVLEEGRGIEVLDFDSFRTAAAKEAKKKAIHDGKIPMVAHKWEAMQSALGTIHEQLESFGIDLSGQVEKRFEWDEQNSITGEIVACSGVVDHVNGLHIDDLKTGSGCVTPRMGSRLIASSHALLQDAAYRSAVSKSQGADVERTTMQFVFVQTEEPFTITPVRMTGEYRELSRLRWQRAIDDWSKYLGRGTDPKFWPGPVDPTVSQYAEVSPPTWMINEEIEKEVLRG